MVRTHTFRVPQPVEVVEMLVDLGDENFPVQTELWPWHVRRWERFLATVEHEERIDGFALVDHRNRFEAVRLGLFGVKVLHERCVRLGAVRRRYGSAGGKRFVHARAGRLVERSGGERLVAAVSATGRETMVRWCL